MFIVTAVIVREWNQSKVATKWASWRSADQVLLIELSPTLSKAQVHPIIYILPTGAQFGETAIWKPTHFFLIRLMEKKFCMPCEYDYISNWAGMKVWWQGTTFSDVDVYKRNSCKIIATICTGYGRIHGTRTLLVHTRTRCNGQNAISTSFRNETIDRQRSSATTALYCKSIKTLRETTFLTHNQIYSVSLTSTVFVWIIKTFAVYHSFGEFFPPPPPSHPLSSVLELCYIRRTQISCMDSGNRKRHFAHNHKRLKQLPVVGDRGI